MTWITDTLAVYAELIARHGPDSKDAAAFRQQVGNQLAPMAFGELEELMDISDKLYYALRSRT